MGLAGERVGRGIGADEEISGDIADMMVNSQAASKSLCAGYGPWKGVDWDRYTCLCGFTGSIACLLSFPNHTDATIT